MSEEEKRIKDIEVNEKTFIQTSKELLKDKKDMYLNDIYNTGIVENTFKSFTDDQLIFLGGIFLHDDYNNYRELYDINHKKIIN